jgi:hypothetical protein
MGAGSTDGVTQKKMIFIILAIFVGLCYYVYKMPGGCHGTCEQGRKSCDCEDNK